MATSRPIDLQELSTYFKMPEKAVAKHLGICLTSLKKICRAHGVTRWPYRKIKSLDKKLKKLEVAMSSSTDPSMVYALSSSSSAPTPSSTSSGGTAEFSASPSPSSPPCSSSASMASTPRHSAAPSCSSISHSSAPSLAQLGEDFMSAAPESDPHHPACFLEASSRAFRGDSGVLHPIAVAAEALMQPVGEEEGASAELEALQQHGGGADDFEYERSPSPDVSDEDLIAMLAQCAGTEGAGRQHPCPREGSAPLVSAPASAGGSDRRGHEGMSDDEIMQALAGCCAFPCGMEEPGFADDHLDMNTEHQAFAMLEDQRA
mmetsp:Transcript_48668/g.121523  ORF Transcript_48668/g.121523 Transcript_48668/m.121523 type:complete len:318 (-) Transcript_48668:595-1548(-)|eukprot:CAMPEP_0173468618 /NCGR_PEP_ID=MMETSP1357-20121228/76935_1 /TAXON_ID=77926 /ORGANISM="Hemiselmis rufescens, Strain PCC563" /LENGTH=317 /DNA_ID=CAMNT_0014436843 /DNA_START=220 /DNA_END=1173 /DNA_ORIENTATION=-